MSYLRYQRYPGILRFWYLPYRLDQVFSEVIPAIPTIPRYFDISVPYHTGSIRYFQQSYPRYPRVPRYFGTYHTSSIWYFQMRYPRYPCVPRYGIPRIFTGVTPVDIQRDALPTAQQLVPTPVSYTHLTLPTILLV